jgi:drug/metabolite transporter (DMT)-like permease
MISSQVMRYTLAGLLLLPLCRHTTVRLKDLPGIIAMAATGLVGTNALILAAERSTDTGTVGIIVGTLPIVVALVAPLPSRRRPDPRVVLCAVIAAGGTVFVESSAGRASVAGIGYAVGALGSELLFIVVGAPVFRRHGALAVSPWLCMTAVCILLILGVPIDRSDMFLLPTAHEALAIVYLGIGPSVVGLLCWGFGLAQLGPERFGLFTGVNPIVALFTAAALGLSTITGERVVGCLLVAGAIAAGASARPPSHSTETAVPRQS